MKKGLAFIASSLLCASPAAMATIVMEEAWILNYDAKKCFEHAAQVANMAGFTDDHEIVKDDPERLFMYAYTPNGTYAYSATCAEVSGTASFAVAGPNPSTVVSYYRKVINAWKKVTQ